MSDKLNEVAKSLGNIKTNADNAIRRYSPEHDKIERVRDIFDTISPFEMEFETKDNEQVMFLDLSFNKPPPLGCPDTGRYILQCQDFCTTVGDGSHLLNVGSPYFPGSVTVFINNVKQDTAHYSEYDPVNGLVYVVGTTEPQNIVICFSRDTWTYQCPETVDPLDDTQNNTGSNGRTYINPSPPFEPIPGASYSAVVDTNDSTQIPQFAYDSTSISQVTASIEDHAGFAEWTVHLGDFANLPDQGFSGNSSSSGSLKFIPIYNVAPYTDAFYNVAGLSIVDGNNLHCSFVLTPICGTNYGQVFYPISGFPERILATINIGPIQINIEEDHDLFIQLGGVYFGPQVRISVQNSGHMNSQGRCASNPALLPNDPGCIPIFQTLGGTDIDSGLPFNQPIVFNIDINKVTGSIRVLANGIAYVFENPVYEIEFLGFGNYREQYYAGGRLNISFTMIENLVDEAYFACIVNDVQITPCGYHPTGV